MKYIERPIEPKRVEALQLTKEAFWDCKDNKKLFWNKFNILGSFNPTTRTITTMNSVYIDLSLYKDTNVYSAEYNDKELCFINDWIIKQDDIFFTMTNDAFIKTYQPDNS